MPIVKSLGSALVCVGGHRREAGGRSRRGGAWERGDFTRKQSRAGPPRALGASDLRLAAGSPRPPPSRLPQAPRLPVVSLLASLARRCHSRGVRSFRPLALVLCKVHGSPRVRRSRKPEPPAGFSLRSALRTPCSLVEGHASVCPHSSPFIFIAQEAKQPRTVWTCTVQCGGHCYMWLPSTRNVSSLNRGVFVEI